MKSTEGKKAPVWLWYGVAVLAVLFAAPNGMIIKLATDDVPAIWVSALRFIFVAVILLPLIVAAIPKMNRKNLKYSLGAGSAYTVAVISFTQAIELSTATYVNVVSLGIPAMIMLYSAYLAKERISRRAAAGIGVAALGAFVVIGVPFLASNGFALGDINPLATIFSIINVLAFPLTIVLSRRANDEGMPVTVSFGISAIIVSTVSIAVVPLLHVPLPLDAIKAQPTVLIPILYSALFVSLFARVMTVSAYPKIGSAAVSGLQYVETFLGIILPVILLGERMTAAMVIGGVLIILGLIVAETKIHPHLHRYRKLGDRH